MNENSKLMKILKNRINEKRAKSVLQVSIGTLLGALDCISTGQPILTVGLPICEYLKMLDTYYKRDFFKKNIASLPEHINGLIAYSLGATIPFVIKYHKEIADLSDKLF